MALISYNRTKTTEVRHFKFSNATHVGSYVLPMQRWSMCTYEYITYMHGGP